MPGFDRTGPLGQGQGTGRQMGDCHTAGSIGYSKPLGMGCRRGFGFGRGRRFRNGPYISQAAEPHDKIAELESQVLNLQQEISALRQQNENRDHQR